MAGGTPASGLDPRMFILPSFVTAQQYDYLEGGLGEIPNLLKDVDPSTLELFAWEGIIFIQPGTGPLKRENIRYPAGTTQQNPRTDSAGKPSGVSFGYHGYSFDIDFSRNPWEKRHAPQ